ncbi:hypothetical protein CDAR_39341 [Caerostris darwini]|uniref:Uncharacterized protein n=1 Tax=Caerostris darwini TaxID=1538125 RepID=A0AAV4U6D0_9ARAC|nr:hypothetical protein CDAR_39341 [Caerostris darwini]
MSEGVSFASMVQGTPRHSPAPVSATGNQRNDNNFNLNVINDSTSKVLYILNEFINLFNSLGGVENIYNKLINCNSPLDKLQVMVTCLENGATNK